MLKISESAANHIQEQIKQANADNLSLRIAAKTNQDGSFEYGMGFDEVKDDDLVSNQYGVELVFDKQSHELLEDATMDYVQLDDGQMGFVFLNPLDPNYIPPKRKK